MTLTLEPRKIWRTPARIGTTRSSTRHLSEAPGPEKVLALVCAIALNACAAPAPPKSGRPSIESREARAAVACNGALERERAAETLKDCAADSTLETGLPQGIWSNDAAKRTVVGSPPRGQTIVQIDDGRLFIRDSSRRWRSFGETVIAAVPLTLEAELHPAEPTSDRVQCTASMRLTLQRTKAGIIHFVLLTQNEDCLGGLWVRTGELSPDPGAERRRQEDEARIKALGYAP